MTRDWSNEKGSTTAPALHKLQLISGSTPPKLEIM